MTVSSSASNYEVYADFNVDMDRDPRSHDILKDMDVEALKTSIRSILLTIPGTRRMQPEFGANLESKLFEPLDETTGRAIGKIITEQIEQWDSAITIRQVAIEVDEDNHRYNISIQYSARDSNINSYSMKFILEQR